MCPRDIFTFENGLKINFLSPTSLPMEVYLFILWYFCKRIVFHLELSDLFETWQKLLENVSLWHIHFWKWPENQLFASYKLGYVGISFHIMVFLQRNSFYSEWGDFSETWQKLLKKVSPWHSHFWKWPEDQRFEYYKFAHGGISFHIMVFLQKNSVLFEMRWFFLNMTKIVKKCVPMTYSLLKVARKSIFESYKFAHVGIAFHIMVFLQRNGFFI
mgnify:CR=1 FL=1